MDLHFFLFYNKKVTTKGDNYILVKHSGHQQLRERKNKTKLNYNYIFGTHKTFVSKSVVS